MKPDFGWSVELSHRKGAPSNMGGIDVFFDFDWDEVVGHPQTQFPFGQCLARRVLCGGRQPSPLADACPHRCSAAYFGDSYEGGLTRISELDAVAGMSAAEIDGLVSAKLTREVIEPLPDGERSTHRRR